MNVDEFKQLPVMGILRGVGAEEIEPLVETVVSSGLQTLEVAMNTPDAAGLIRRMAEVADGRLTMGAGTVLTMDDLQLALDAGATFVVLPTLVPEVVEYCRQNAVPVFPGALTPQEIHNAWCAGATMVKVFPAKFFGPDYFQEVKGPFPGVELLACGGVSSDNIQSYFSCGASAVAFGASVFKREWLAAGEFARIGKCIEALIAEFRAWDAR